MSSGFYFDQVLIVDDSEIDVLVNRRLMELTRFAANIAVTTNGEEALNYLRNECSSAEKAPEYIFLDMHLPGLNGYDFIEEFKSMPSFIVNKSRIIVLSVFQNPEHLKKVLENDFVIGQLEKPLTQHVLKELGENKKLPFSASF